MSITMPSGYLVGNKADAHKAGINYHKVVYPKPEILPECKNCSNYRYDSNDYCNSRGDIALSNINLRCHLHRIRVQAHCVCDDHHFAYPDRRDR